MADQTFVRPELIDLESAARQQVLAQVAAKGGHCESCGGTDFAVGHALYLGFLFYDEDLDAYMVALTCRNPTCPKPRTGIVLHDKDFLSDGSDRADTVYRARASQASETWGGSGLR